MEPTTKRALWEIMERDLEGITFKVIATRAWIEHAEVLQRLRGSLNPRDAGRLDGIEFVLGIPEGIRKEAEQEQEQKPKAKEEGG